MGIYSNREFSLTISVCHFRSLSLYKSCLLPTFLQMNNKCMTNKSSSLYDRCCSLNQNQLTISFFVSLALLLVKFLLKCIYLLCFGFVCFGLAGWLVGSCVCQFQRTSVRRCYSHRKNFVHAENKKHKQHFKRTA